MTRPRTDGEFEQEIGALADHSRPALIERWQALYRAGPPKGLSRRLLILGVAHRMQAKRYDRHEIGGHHGDIESCERHHDGSTSRGSGRMRIKSRKDQQLIPGYQHRYWTRI